MPGEFTFAPPPGWAEVGSYRYTFDGENFTDVPAGADGTATITWTPAASGRVSLSAWVFRPDGSVGDYSAYYDFEVA